MSMIPEGMSEALLNSWRYVMLLAPVGFCWLLTGTSLPRRIVSDVFGLDSSPLFGMFRRMKDAILNQKREYKDYAYWADTTQRRCEEVLKALNSSREASIVANSTPLVESSDSLSVEQKEALDKLKKDRLNSLREIEPLLNFLDELLNFDSFIVGEEDYEERFRSIRSIYPNEFNGIVEKLLRLWDLLFNIVKEIEEEDKPFWKLLGPFVSKSIEETYLRLLTSITKRGELDSFFNYEKRQEEEKAKEMEKKLLELVLNTQVWVQTKMQNPIPYFQRSALHLFCIKYLALSYFRLSDEVGAIINEIFEESEERRNLIKELESKYEFEFKRENKENESENIQRSCDSLFLWKETMDKRGEREENEEKMMETIKSDARWTQSFVDDNNFFFIFFKEWMQLILSRKTQLKKKKAERKKEGNRIEWESFEGYYRMLGHLLVITSKQPEKIGGFLSDCVIASVTTRPGLFSFYSKVLFLNTPTDRFITVLDALSKFETWINAIDSNGVVFSDRDFDSNFFIRVLNVMYDFDHHQVVGKSLSILYSRFDIFEEEVQQKIFIEYLLEDKFDYLFLHWDEAVRNSFQQILVFKTGRINRSLITHPKEKSEGDEFKTKLYNKTEDQLERIKAIAHDISPEDRFPDTKKLYASRSLEEYNFYLSRFESWKVSGGKIPRMVPLSFIRAATKPNPPS
eukprot:TRINITY_DN6243_c0_g1_i4.p1 TRINITY_DN6243_c0_g1~~TRINITY_DN6243_c0_g1_i4.p1  ORF type:complete len:685 (-),score=249.68 TRINITY_DN6243_c0_g1_i4:40-2094(-)